MKMKLGKQRRISLIFVAIMLAMVVPFMTVTTAVAAEIDVPDDYSTIQDAIDAAGPGDTIYVAAGIYQEQITIDKSVDLIGAGESTTTIQAPLALK